jgi:hypothetical protein
MYEWNDLRKCLEFIDVRIEHIATYFIESNHLTCTDSTHYCCCCGQFINLPRIRYTRPYCTISLNVMSMCSCMHVCHHVSYNEHYHWLMIKLRNQPRISIISICAIPYTYIIGNKAHLHMCIRRVIDYTYHMNGSHSEYTRI